jgi:hypothetical protein
MTLGYNLTMRCEEGTTLARELPGHAARTRSDLSEMKGFKETASEFVMQESERRLTEHDKQCEICRAQQ